MAKVTSLGIIGAGKLGITLAQLALKAGFQVYIAGSKPAEAIALTVEILAPGAHAASSTEVAQQAEVIILALPLSKFKQLPKQALAGKLVIDATNHWWEVDGPRDDFLSPQLASSQAVQAYLSQSRVVKAFNHMGYHHLHDEARPTGQPERKAIALAGDNLSDIATVSQIIDRLGFDPVPIGSLAQSYHLEAGHPAFGANLTAPNLLNLLQSDTSSIS